MRLVGKMKKKDDRIIDIVSSEASSDYASFRDELLRLSGAFSTLERMKPQDLKRLSEKGLDATGRLVILSQILLPQLCSIIERGLTLEEIGLLVGLDQKGMKRVFKKPEIKKAATIISGTVDKEKFMKVLVPLKTTIRTAKGEVKERPVKEPLLAPRRLVERVQRTGYITREGRVLSHDYLSLVSGPFPTIYLFQTGREAAEESMGDDWKVAMGERMADDQGAIRAKLEIAVAVLGFLRPLFQSEQASILAQKLAAFFFATYENAVHYASRHRALNDQATFDRIEALVRPFLYTAEGLERSEWTVDQGSRERIVEAIDKVMAELEAVIDGRAILLPGVASELSKV